MTKVETISDQSQKIFHEVIAAISPEQSKSLKIFLWFLFSSSLGRSRFSSRKTNHTFFGNTWTESLAAVASLYLVLRYIKTDSYFPNIYYETIVSLEYGSKEANFSIAVIEMGIDP